MKTAIFLSLLAIGYLIYWNWSRLKERYKPIAARAAGDARTDELMKGFGDNRKRLAEIKQTYAARFGRAADRLSSWSLVTRSVELATANLTSFKFEMASHFMAEAVRFAGDILDAREREQSASLADSVGGGIANGGIDGLEETRRCVQNALNRRG